MPGSDLEALSSGRLALSDVLEWSGGLPGCPKVLWRPSRMTGSAREALPDAWER